MRKYWHQFRRLFGTPTPGEQASAGKGFVDIHSHIIPAIDDGPSQIEGVLEMLRKSYEGGTREMVATPHMFLEIFGNIDPQIVSRAFEDTVRELEELAEATENSFLKKMSFYSGAENLLSQEFLNALETEAVLTINGGRYLLVESPPHLSVIHLRHTIQKVLKSRFIPIIAHPERYRAFQERPGQMSEFVEWGCLSQINAGSLLGIYGRQAKKTSWALLAQNLVHVVASDNHGFGTRSHDLGTVYPVLRRKFRENQTDRWLRTNPGAIVRNLQIDG